MNVNKIILCCVHPLEETYQIQDNEIKEIINNYGTVKDMVLFKKGITWKYFIELKKVDEVINILDNLNRVTFSIGKINVYESKKKFLRRKPKSFYDEKSMHKVTTCETLENYEFESGKEFLINENEINFKISENYFISEKNNFLSCEHDDFIFNNKMENSKVIFIKISDLKNITCNNLINLFGCFGNVKTVVINTKKNFSLIQYQNNSQVILAIKNLGNKKFFKTTLKMCSLPFSKLNIKQFDNKNIKNILFMQGHFKYFRFKKGLKIKVNEISKILHITSISEKLCPIIFYDIISLVNKPIEIVKLKKNGNNSSMFLIKFRNSKESLEVLSVLHNLKVENKILKLSFSHTNLI